MKYNKKYLSFFIIGLFVFSMLGVGMVSAQANEVVQALFGTTKGNNTDNVVITLAAFLLALLVIYGVISPLKIFGDKEWINGIIALIVSYIGVRFVEIEMLKSFTLPSEGLIGAIFLIVPFLVVAALIVKGTTNDYLRRALWCGYAGIMLVLWFRAVGIQKLGWAEFLEGSTPYFGLNLLFANKFYLIYLVIALICLLAFWFDGTLQKFLRKSKDRRVVEATTEREVDRVLAKINDLEQTRILKGESGDFAGAAKIQTQIANLKKAAGIK